MLTKLRQKILNEKTRIENMLVGEHSENMFESHLWASAYDQVLLWIDELENEPSATVTSAREGVSAPVRIIVGSLNENPQRTIMSRPKGTEVWVEHITARSCYEIKRIAALLAKENPGREFAIVRIEERVVPESLEVVT